MSMLQEKLTTYHIKTPQFEGPLDLLLTLIEKRKLFINDISLAEVSHDYIETIKRLETFPTEDATSFLLIASTLVLLKSKSLLPKLPLTTEEEGDIEDLQHRLLEYQRMKQLSAHVEALYLKKPLYEQQNTSYKKTVLFSPDKNTTIAVLSVAIENILEHLPKEATLPSAQVKKIIRLEDVMQRLSERIARTLKMSFRDFSRSESENKKAEVIVSFIAMLELVKTGVITVTQNNLYDDIEMQAQNLGVPHYDNL
jgi:segregation and condensation protein A